MLNEKRTNKIMVKIGSILSLFLFFITATYFIVEEESFDMTFGHTIFPTSILLFSLFSFIFLLLETNKKNVEKEEEKLEQIFSMLVVAIFTFLSFFLLSAQIIKDIQYNFFIFNLRGLIPYLACTACIIFSIMWFRIFYFKYKRIAKL